MDDSARPLLYTFTQLLANIFLGDLQRAQAASGYTHHGEAETWIVVAIRIPCLASHPATPGGSFWHLHLSAWICGSFVFSVPPWRTGSW